MHIDDQTYRSNGKTYRRILLRNSYRVNGKVRHDTIASLCKCTEAEINAIKIALKYKDNLTALVSVRENLKTEQGLSVGATWLLSQVAKKLGITKILGDSKEAKLILWLVIATLIEQGSRLSATRLAIRHAACDILRIEDGFNEDDLYSAMDWLEKKQAGIEYKLFKLRYGKQAPNFYLYDVTSSYFEGQQNELANFGYNRDKKAGKMQIVIGLMTDDEGNPITIEVFEGNTQDPKTVSSQIKKIAERFGVKKVTLVGDRGMIKKLQIKELNDDYKFNYITAITKPQIEKLINDGAIQLSFLDENITEVGVDGVRYVMRRNPVRADEIESIRQSKLARIQNYLNKKNVYLAEHSRAKAATAAKEIRGKINKFKIQKWLEVRINGRVLSLEINNEQKAQESKLDGCYVIKTDLKTPAIEAKTVHDRYKDLTLVENAFRTMKTSFLELRPIFVRKEERTRAHVFIIMLAYMIEYQLRKDWRDIDITVREGVTELSSISTIKIKLPENVSYQAIPVPKPIGRELLKAAGVILPAAIPLTNATVYTKKKLISER
jgi:transposase